MQAVILLASAHIMGEMFGNPNKAELARSALRAGQYTSSDLIEVEAETPEDVAEELFDLTNNPSRQEEREQKYGRGRSMSVGDIALAGGEMWLCVSMGWEKL